MYIEQICISGFRNLKEETTFSFVNGKNIIYGPNGSGKTSVLEAIYLLGFGRSFLSVKKSEIQNNDSPGFYIRSSVIRSENQSGISAVYDKNFSLFLNEEKTGIAGVGKYMFPLFFSSSDYVSLISSSSALRKLFDKFIFGMDILYSNHLIEYKKVIRNKSSLLKQSRDIPHLNGWNKMMSELVLKISTKRFHFVQRLNKMISSKKFGNMKIRYIPSIPLPEDPELWKESEIFNTLDRLTRKELLMKTPLAGIHLDRYEIDLEGKLLKFYSSGEKKVNLLFVYLAYIEMFLDQRGEYPVFLVDDYDIAMDESNTKLLVSNYPEMQVIATSVRNNKNFEKIIKLKP